MGFLYPIGGFIAFAIPLCVCTEPDPDNPLVDEAFDENDRLGTGLKDTYAKPKNNAKVGPEKDNEMNKQESKMTENAINDEVK